MLNFINITIKFLKTIIILGVLFLILTPTLTLAAEATGSWAEEECKAGTCFDKDDQEGRCWTQDNCKEVNGIWGGLAEVNDELSDRCSNKGNLPTARCFVNNPDISLQVGIPGIQKFCGPIPLDKVAGKGDYKACSNNKECGNLRCMAAIQGGFPGYLQKFYTFFVSALAVVAVVMIMWGGFKRIMAVGNQEQITSANETITGSLIGLMIALGAYTVLNLINPRIVENTMPRMEKVKSIVYGFCPKEATLKGDYTITSKKCVNTGNKKVKGSEGPYDGGACVNDSGCVWKNNLGLEQKAGKCVTRDQDDKKLTGNDDGTCGKIIEYSGKECMGLECKRAEEGCFQVKDEDKNNRRCSNYLLKGDLSRSLIKIENIKFLEICNNGTTKGDCQLHKPFAKIASSGAANFNVEDQESYVIGSCSDSISELEGYCQNNEGFKGFALLVEVNEEAFAGLAADDWFAVDMETCKDAITKSISFNGETDPDDFEAEDLKNIDSKKLITIDSLGLHDEIIQASGGNTYSEAYAWTPLICNLNINRTNFPAR